MRRVTRPGGLIVVYEHNPQHPLTRKIVRDCVLDRDAVLLTMAQTSELLTKAGCSDVSTRSILTLPPAHPFIEKFDKLFAKLPFGSQNRAVGRIPFAVAWASYRLTNNRLSMVEAWRRPAAYRWYATPHNWFNRWNGHQFQQGPCTAVVAYGGSGQEFWAWRTSTTTLEKIAAPWEIGCNK
jgi:hypothetical protein